MIIIAVDDEKNTLEALTRKLKDILPDADVKCFNSPRKALEYASENNEIDIAFLDIEMPGMTGLELAKAFKSINPSMGIIFTTGFSQYAVDAFGVYANGYLMKPISSERLKDAIDHYLSTLSHPAEANVPTSRVYVQTFGNFEVFLDGKPMSFSRSKSKELFAYLIDRNGSSVTTGEIISVLWEDKPNSNAMQSHARTIIASLINAFKEADLADVIIKQRNQLAVDKNKVDCDYFMYLAGSTTAKEAFHGEYMTNYSWAEMTLAELVGDSW